MERVVELLDDKRSSYRVISADSILVVCFISCLRPLPRPVP